MRSFAFPGRSTAHSLNGMVATSSPLATLAGVEVLKTGGNAVDAAVTAAGVLCITEPHMTGIGGDCFALIGLPDGKVAGINGSGRAAKAADARWLSNQNIPCIDPDGVHAVTVPGAIDAWDKLLGRFGTITLREALAPAIAAARQGVAVTPRVAHDWKRVEERLGRDAGCRKHYLPHGRAPAHGEIMRYPALAATLETIARHGRGAMYEGEVADHLTRHLKSLGGLLTMKDFAATEASWVEPVASEFHGTEVLEIPPSSQGITALLALNILSHLDVGRQAPESAGRRHLEIEAMRLAWRFRNRYIADPKFASLPVDKMLSAETAGRLARLVCLDRALDEEVIAGPGSDTVYLSVVDRNRLAVSFINSLFDSFGSGIVEPETGIVLQNRGACFVTDPDHPNCIGPGKRPLHTLMPALCRTNGRVTMSFGVMGGSYQPMGHVAVLVNRLIYGMDSQEALDFPRSHPQDGLVVIEDGVPELTAAGLAAKGHRVVRGEEPLGGGQIVEIDWERATLAGASDPRKDGVALGC
jgi:gamma-glutamyltranspeptidase/glutathione hydrolase